MFVRRYRKIVKGKLYTTTYLAEAVREGKKIKTIHKFNISGLSDEQIDAIDAALKVVRGEEFTSPEHALSLLKNVEIQNSRSFGGFYTLLRIMERIGLSSILGNSEEALLVKFMVISRVIHPASKRSTAFWLDNLQLHEIFRIKCIVSEDRLYQAMDILDGRQEEIEDRLFERLKNDKPNLKLDLFLYDVTSSYLEGECNELAEYGYNRDKKKGKKQIVIGLLTASEGTPVSIQVFKGNTSDSTTVSDQIKKLISRFKVERVTMVGDRGMIKSAQIKEIKDSHFHYITALTKAQIRKMIENKIIEKGLFDEKLMEVEHEGERYILRRNPVRADELKNTLEKKMAFILTIAEKVTQYLNEHPRAKSDKGLEKVIKKAEKISVAHLMNIKLEGREIKVIKDEDRINEESGMDGCYCLRTDVFSSEIPMEIIHDRYKALAKVENNFRDMKMSHLEVRPVYHYKENRTRAHVFLAMLALRLLHELEESVIEMKEPINEIICALNEICAVDLSFKGVTMTRVATPTGLADSVLKKLKINLPSVLNVRANDLG